MLCCCAGDLSALREKTFSLKEGATYRLKIDFKVRCIESVTEVCLGWKGLLYITTRTDYCVYVCVDDQVFTVSGKDIDPADKPSCTIPSNNPIKQGHYHT